MKAVKKFKQVIAKERPPRMEGILGRDARFVQPPLSMSTSEKRGLHKSRSVDTHDRRNLEQALVAEGVHRDLHVELCVAPPDRGDAAIAFVSPTTKPVELRSDHSVESPDSGPSNPISPKRNLDARPQDHRPPSTSQTTPSWASKDYHKGHAHNPLEDHLYVGVGPGSEYDPEPPAVSESPPAAEINIYEAAYHEQVERIRARQGRAATLFLTRRVDKEPEYKNDENLIGPGDDEAGDSAPKSGIAKLLDVARKSKESKSRADGTVQEQGEGKKIAEDS